MAHHVVKLEPNRVERYLRWTRNIVSEFLARKENKELNEMDRKLNSIGEKYPPVFERADKQFTCSSSLVPV
jgi:hypothetical protein